MRTVDPGAVLPETIRQCEAAACRYAEDWQGHERLRIRTIRFSGSPSSLPFTPVHSVRNKTVSSASKRSARARAWWIVSAIS